MNRRLSASILFGGLLCVLVIAACGGNGDGEGGGSLEVTFDGTDCGFRGPETVSESNISVLIDNQAATVVTLDVLRLEDGKSFDDLASHIEGAEGPNYLPSWASSITATPAAAGEMTTFGMALTAGSYALVCVTELPLGVQAVAPFTVTVEN